MNPADVKNMISNGLRSVRQALRGMLASASGSKQVVLVQMAGKKGETFTGAEYFQHAGLRSVPLAGMQPIIVPLNGSSSNAVVVAMSNGKMFIVDLQPGEVAIFNEGDGAGNSVILRNGRIIDMTCDVLNIHATTAVNIQTATLSMSASAGTTLTTPNTNTTGSIHADGDVTSQGVSLPGHKHPGIVRGGARSDPPG
jgi:phage baseplate assembly protein V